MRFENRKRGARLSPGGSIQVGFSPTMDCAVLIVAQELGFFRKQGLAVELSREVGWATLREKILHEELDVAATQPVVLFTGAGGLGPAARSCLTGLMFGCSGTGITLSRELWDSGVRDAVTLGEHVRRLHPGRRFTFGIPLEFSAQHAHLRRWLSSGGINAGQDVGIVALPSAVMYDTFRHELLDGFCVAEPWNSLAVLEGTGWVAAAAGHGFSATPEKVLIALDDFAQTRKEEHVRLIAALIQASRFCADAENAPELIRLLSSERAFNLDRKVLQVCLGGKGRTGLRSGAEESAPPPHLLGVQAPDAAAIPWIFEMEGALAGAGEERPLGRIESVFRPDIYREALRLLAPTESAPVAAQPMPPRTLSESPRPPSAPGYAALSLSSAHATTTIA